MPIRYADEFDEMVDFVTGTDEEYLDEDEIEELTEWSQDEWENYEE